MEKREIEEKTIVFTPFYYLHYQSISLAHFFFLKQYDGFFDVKNGMHIKVEGKSSKKITVTTIFK